MNQNNRQSILCPNCRKLISKSESRCPYCGISNPGSRVKSVLAGGFQNPESFMKAVVFINAGMYILSLIFSMRLSGMPNPLAMLSPDGRLLYIMGAAGTGSVNGLQGWWTLVSANFLHGGLIHIIFNMMAFYQLCPMVLHEYGMPRTILIYFISGVIGFWVSILAGVYSTIGASAAICGLMGALVFYGKSRGGTYGGMVYRQVGGWVIGLFVFGLIIPNINNWAHAGGLLAGVVSGFLLGYAEKKKENGFHRSMAGIAVLIMAVVLVRSVFQGFVYRFF